jgi:hypothetical protein
LAEWRAARPALCQISFAAFFSRGHPSSPVSTIPEALIPSFGVLRKLTHEFGICRIPAVEMRRELPAKCNAVREPERFVDSLVAAKSLSIKPRQLLELTRKGAIQAYPLGEGKRRVWRFRLSVLANAMEERMVRGSGIGPGVVTISRRVIYRWLHCDGANHRIDHGKVYPFQRHDAASDAEREFVATRSEKRREEKRSTPLP